MLRQITLSNSAKPRGKPVDGGATIDEALGLLGTLKSFDRNAEIYTENEPAHQIYKVISGAARTCRILADGRRQIAAFCLPDDILGLELRSERTFSAEAITELTVIVAERSALVALVENGRDGARQFWSSIGRELLRVQDHALLLGKKSPERVAAFLLEMADRLPGGSCLELPMPRQDIADYLGLTIETVSRTFTALERCHAIQLPTSRHVIIHDRSSLVRLAHGGC